MMAVRFPQGQFVFPGARFLLVLLAFLLVQVATWFVLVPVAFATPCDDAGGGCFKSSESICVSRQLSASCVQDGYFCCAGGVEPRDTLGMACLANGEMGNCLLTATGCPGGDFFATASCGSTGALQCCVIPPEDRPPANVVGQRCLAGGDWGTCANILDGCSDGELRGSPSCDTATVQCCIPNPPTLTCAQLGGSCESSALGADTCTAAGGTVERASNCASCCIPGDCSGTCRTRCEAGEKTRNPTTCITQDPTKANCCIPEVDATTACTVAKTGGVYTGTCMTVSSLATNCGFGKQWTNAGECTTGYVCCYEAETQDQRETQFNVGSDDPTQQNFWLVPCVGNTECTICHLLQLAQRLINWFVFVVVLVAALLFANAGILYVMSPGNTGNIARAHRIFLNTLIGLLIVIAAWLMTDLVMKMFYNGAWGPWQGILCKGGIPGQPSTTSGTIPTGTPTWPGTAPGPQDNVGPIINPVVNPTPYSTNTVSGSTAVLAQAGVIVGTENAIAPSQSSIFFDFDSSVVDPVYSEMLDEHAEFLKTHPNETVVLQGHTDERGTGQYNLQLGHDRADAVRDELIARGVDPTQIRIETYSEYAPLAAGSNEESWRLNRRVDFVYDGSKPKVSVDGLQQSTVDELLRMNRSLPSGSVSVLGGTERPSATLFGSDGGYRVILDDNEEMEEYIQAMAEEHGYLDTFMFADSYVWTNDDGSMVRATDLGSTWDVQVLPAGTDVYDRFQDDVLYAEETLAMSGVASGGTTDDTEGPPAWLADISQARTYEEGVAILSRSAQEGNVERVAVFVENADGSSYWMDGGWGTENRVQVPTELIDDAARSNPTRILLVHSHPEPENVVLSPISSTDAIVDATFGKRVEAISPGTDFEVQAVDRENVWSVDTTGIVNNLATHDADVTAFIQNNPPLKAYYEEALTWSGSADEAVEATMVMAEQGALGSEFSQTAYTLQNDDQRVTSSAQYDAATAQIADDLSEARLSGSALPESSVEAYLDAAKGTGVSITGTPLSDVVGDSSQSDSASDSTINVWNPEFNEG